MGRCIYCSIGDEREFVYKYYFAKQPSEMGRIYEEFGIGFYCISSYNCDIEILVLDRGDAERINEKINEIRKYNSLRFFQEVLFVQMLEAIRDFITKHPEIERFILESQF